MDVLHDSFLTIESAIRGGSIALFSNGRLLVSRVGDGAVSRSEDLLPNVAEMLNEAGVPATQLELIIVSRGPGSFTGIRIGIATAMGLGDSLSIPVLGVSLFDAIGRSLDEPRNALIVAPIGRTDLAWQRLEYGSPGNDRGSIGPRAGTVNDFLVSVRESVGAKIYCHSSIREVLEDRLEEGAKVIEIGSNLAEIVGNSILQGDEYSSSLEPIYVSNSTLRT